VFFQSRTFDGLQPRGLIRSTRLFGCPGTTCWTADTSAFTRLVIFGHTFSRVISLTHCLCSRLFLISDDVYVSLSVLFSNSFVVHPPLSYQKRPVAIFSHLGSLCQPEDASAVAIMSCSFSCFCTILCVMMSQLCHSEGSYYCTSLKLVYLYLVKRLSTVSRIRQLLPLLVYCPPLLLHKRARALTYHYNCCADLQRSRNDDQGWDRMRTQRGGGWR